MKVITVKQPWTYGISHLGKPIENRTWWTTYRGPLAIHSGASWDEDGATDDRILDALHATKVDGRFEPPLHVLLNTDRTRIVETLRKDVRYVFSAIVAVAELVDVCTVRRSVEECECGPWAAPGQCHWRLANVRQLAEPVPCKGRLGLWDLTPADAEEPSEIECAVMAQLAADEQAREASR